jgi:cytochrome c oxidase cbb3-type subunit 4
MNTLTRAAAETVQMGWVLGIMTVVFLAFFIGWTVWAYSPRRKAELEEAARLPFMDGGLE